MKTTNVGRHNERVYGSSVLARTFRTRTNLFPPEAAILQRLGATFVNAEILDIGVGGGRTTAHLAQLSALYTGIDYSPAMIAQCRHRYPKLRFEVCDARDLSRFAAGHFDAVFFSFNGLDYVGHSDRLRVLREVARVLVAGGTFVFSSHNRDCAITNRPWDHRHLPWRTNPIKHPLWFLKRLVDYPIGIASYFVNRRREEQHAEYAILNDSANTYRMLTYYISIECQIAQLERSGYTGVEVVGCDGRWLAPQEYRGCTVDPYLHYVCRSG